MPPKLYETDVAGPWQATLQMDGFQLYIRPV